MILIAARVASTSSRMLFCAKTAETKSNTVQRKRAATRTGLVALFFILFAWRKFLFDNTKSGDGCKVTLLTRSDFKTERPGYIRNYPKQLKTFGRLYSYLCLFFHSFPH